MKVAIASLYLPGGSKIGVGYQVHMLANALTERGHEVTVFSSCPSGPGALYTPAVIPARRRLSTFGFAWDLRQIDFSGFDVLNAHGDDWFLWGKGRPRHVHTYHGSCFAEMLNARNFSTRVRMAALAVCEYSSLLLCHARVTVSENTRRYIPGIEHVIPCGVDTQRFSPGPTKHGRPTLLFVGTMHGRKRGRMLLDAFVRDVQPAVPDAEMWCVCERPEGLEPPPGVRFFGRIPEDELIDLYRRAWVFCLPSTYEGFGVPYIEAMACGTAVVASPNPGAVEVTRGGTAGRLVGDAQLGETLTRLLTDTEERDRLSSAGLHRSEAFGWPTVCSAYEAVYRGQVPVTETNSTAATPAAAETTA